MSSVGKYKQIHRGVFAQLNLRQQINKLSNPESKQRKWKKFINKDHTQKFSRLTTFKTNEKKNLPLKET